MTRSLTLPLDRPALRLVQPVWRIVLLVGCVVLAAAATLVGGFTYANAPLDAPLVTDSTLAELALWMTEQATNQAAARSLLGSWAQQTGNTDPVRLTQAVQAFVALWSIATSALTLGGIFGILRWASWTRPLLTLPLIGNAWLLLLIPVIDGDFSVSMVLIALALLLVVMFMAAGRVTPLIGVLVALSALVVMWEGVKGIASASDFVVAVPASNWSVTPYSTLDEALSALQDGAIAAVWADRKDLDKIMPAIGDTPVDGLAYPALRHLSLKPDRRLIFPIVPDAPGRLSIAVRVDEATRYRTASDLIASPVGVVQASFADERYLALPRQLILLDLKIFNDLNLPHVQVIFEAFLQPARRNGDFLLARILAGAALFTWQEAVIGFMFGVLLGLSLGTAFAHSRLMERALLPYVVASQTVPILAIAPMVVIWLGASPTSVAVIAAYITFFPVTINTLRGLQSPNPLAIELMQSYAARWDTILWKLRFPSALPYIFAALKVSATASVVGAIIGELPSGISDGLGRAILNFSSDYSAVSTPKLWAAIISATLVGAVFFLLVSLIERIVLRRYVRGID